MGVWLMHLKSKGERNAKAATALHVGSCHVMRMGVVKGDFGLGVNDFVVKRINLVLRFEKK